MAPRRLCQICRSNPFKYTCPVDSCSALYCSAACFKEHKETSCTKSLRLEETVAEISQSVNEPPPLSDPKPLRPLTSLKWPYIPEESAFPDPLKRDDPKPLQLRHYEAIATSARIRALLGNLDQNDDDQSSSSRGSILRPLLKRVDALRGHEKEVMLQHALGVGDRDVREFTRRGGRQHYTGTDEEKLTDEEVLAMRKLAEAVEQAIRQADGKKKDLFSEEHQAGLLGLDWDSGAEE